MLARLMVRSSAEQATACLLTGDAFQRQQGMRSPTGEEVGIEERRGEDEGEKGWGTKQFRIQPDR